MPTEYTAPYEGPDEPVPNLPQKAALVAGASPLALIPQTLEQAYRLAQAVVEAGLTPQGLDTPARALIAILTGLELGIPPMQAVQGIAVINGRPCIWGDLQLAIVRRSPRCAYVKEWIEGEGDDRVAWCETLRRGETEPIRRSFSVRDAIAAGLWQTAPTIKRKNRQTGQAYETANDSPWFRYQPRMLQHRARSWCLRDTYADDLKGLNSAEEMRDTYPPEEAVDITPPKTSGPAFRERMKERLAGKVVPMKEELIREPVDQDQIIEPEDVSQDGGDEDAPIGVQEDAGETAGETVQEPGDAPQADAESAPPAPVVFTAVELTLISNLLEEMKAVNTPLQQTVLEEGFLGAYEHQRPEVQAKMRELYADQRARLERDALAAPKRRR